MYPSQVLPEKADYGILVMELRGYATDAESVLAFQIETWPTPVPTSHIGLIRQNFRD
jgi:hypothetical protein